MPYQCDSCAASLPADHLLGLDSGVSYPIARACSSTCATAWESTRPFKAEAQWEWKLITEWIAGWRAESQPFYIQPPDDVPVWRYVDLTKFLDLLQTSELFLTAGHLLGDPYEGSLSEETLRQFRELAESMSANTTLRALPGFDAEAYKDFVFRGRRGNYEWERQWTYVNCWHMNEHESAAMWAAYGGRQDAIAVRSTVRRLRKCIQPHRHPPMGEPLLLAVHYRDFSKEAVKTDVHISTMLQKRKSFEHEREVRILVQKLPLEGEPVPGGRRYDLTKAPLPGIRLSVDLIELVEEVYVSPNAPDWLLKAITELVRKYGLLCPVQQSSLLEGAIF